jgi:hypothetical protein
VINSVKTLLSSNLLSKNINIEIQRSVIFPGVLYVCVWLGLSPEGRRSLARLRLRWIILKWIFKNWDGEAWTEMLCLRIGINGGSL